MNKKVKEFLDLVCSEIRCKAVHQEIKQELELHIEDLTIEYQNQGLSTEEAVSKALSDMGDANQIGKKLHREHKPQMGWGVLLLTAFVSVFGIILMCIPQFPGREGGSLERTLHFMALGSAVLFATYFFDYTKWKKNVHFFYIVGAVLIVLCLLFGIQYAGAKRYLSIFSFRLYVPGVSAICFLISFCGFLERFRSQGVWGMIQLIGLAFGSVFLLCLMPCLSFAFFLVVTYGIVFMKAVYQNHFSKNGKKSFALLMGIGGFFGILTAVTTLLIHPYRAEKLLLFFHKGATDPQGSGWMYMITDKILHACRWFGKAHPIPEGELGWIMPSLTEDFALLNLIGNFGWVFGIFLILLILSLIVWMLSLVRRVKNPYGKMLSLSCCLMLGIQFLCNILMNLGLFPMLEVVLPFVSSGGSFYLIHSFLVGVVLSVWRRNKILPEHNEPSDESLPQRKRITFENKKLIIDFGMDGSKP